MRGFGANNNTRVIQLVDGKDNRSPGLGFGFGNAAGISDLDVQSIELLPGASSALYGPDALQGLMLTKSKNPFQTQGLSAQVRVGVNNVGNDDFSAPTPYTDIAVRYAETQESSLSRANCFASHRTTRSSASNDLHDPARSSALCDSAAAAADARRTG